VKILVTGGTGLLGAAAVDRLIEEGHGVRLLSRNAAEDCRRWPQGVEPHAGDVTSDDGVRGAAEGCDGVLHTVGIVAESPPEATYQAVNVEGTRRVALEAKRAGCGRFVHVSSLGAERGDSPYHRSKLKAEQVVREAAPAGWLILRPGNVYGPGDQEISLLLQMVRSLPVVPTVGWGNQPFQPVWHRDVGEVLARAVLRREPAGVALDLAGAEVTSIHELLRIFTELTGTRAPRVPVPEFLARLGARVAEAVGVELPVNDSQLKMLAEGNVIPAGGRNALVDVFQVKPTPLREGLRRLVDALPEQLPSEGLGPLRRERFWADIEGSRLDASGLFELVCARFAELPPKALVEVGAEPGSPVTLAEGHTLSLAVPMRGHVQVRVAEVKDHTATLLTVAGHFLAGAIRLMVRAPAADAHPDERVEPGRVRFEVRSYTRAATLPDLVAMRTVGAAAQALNWSGVVEEVVRRSGGRAPRGVQREFQDLDEREAGRVEAWVRELSMRLKRKE
jgi:uncharacterized protein YbjT (DUF2867 family)